MNDKRSFQRTNIELKAKINPSDKEKNEIQVLNLSGGGICIQCNNEVEIGKEIEIQISLAENINVSVKVKVVWLQKENDKDYYKIGMSIIDADSEEFERFLEFYCKQLKKDD